MGKRFFLGILLFSLLVVLSPPAALADTVFTIGSNSYISSGITFPIDTAPQIINSRTLVPVRYLAESCGAEVEWDPLNRVVTLKDGQTTIKLTIGSKQELVNGKPLQMDVAPTIINSRTMLPARWVAEYLGQGVSWDGKKETVTIYPRQAYVQVGAINVRQQPSLKSGFLRTLPQYTSVEVQDSVNGWYKINLPDGGAGWIAGWLTTPIRHDTDMEAISRGGSRLSPGLLEGLGVWTNVWRSLPDSYYMAKFQNAGIKRIYLQVARTPEGFPKKWQEFIDTMVPAAHRAGMEVVGWVYTTLEDPVSDAKLVAQVSNYKTPTGEYLDAVAADIEKLPQNDTARAGEIVKAFAQAAYSELRPNCPLLAITYPPQQRPNYPFTVMAESSEGVLLMDYWHVEERGYEQAEAERFVIDSVNILKRAGCRAPIEVILQGCDIGHGIITADEMKGAANGARSSGVSSSLYLYDPPDPEVWNAFVSGSR